MVTSVEGGLTRQIDCERSARSAALADLRQELAMTAQLHFPSFGPSSMLSSTRASTANSPETSGGPPIVRARVCPPIQNTANAVPSCFREDGALKQLREAVGSLEQRAEERVTETENALSVLRTDLEALRAEQRLEGVVASALALASSGLSSHSRLRAIKALEDRAAAGAAGAAGGAAGAAGGAGSKTTSTSPGGKDEAWYKGHAASPSLLIQSTEVSEGAHSYGGDVTLASVSTTGGGKPAAIISEEEEKRRKAHWSHDSSNSNTVDHVSEAT